MSWSLQTEPTKRDLLDDAIGEKVGVAAKMQGEADEEFVLHQINVAQAAVDALVRSGYCGDESVYLRAALSGHANPNHVPREGYANDMININVHQVAAP